MAARSGESTHSPHPARLRWAQHRLSRPRPKGAPRRGRRALTVLCYNQGSGRGGACCGVPVIEGDTPQLQGYRGTGSPGRGPGAAPQGGRLLLIGAVFAGLAALRKTACILGNVCYNGKRSCSGGARTPRSVAQVRYHPGKGSIAQPALGDNTGARVFCYPGQRWTESLILPRTQHNL